MWWWRGRREASDTTKDPDVQSTDSPAATTTVTEAATTTTVASTTTTAGLKLTDLEDSQQEQLEFLCFAAVVEGKVSSDPEGTRLQILSGELGVPGLEELLMNLTANANFEDVLDEFAEGVGPICEDLGWTR